ncbi:Hypothetical protein FKW44_014537 [Caligus rogercresseyi]|uniref:Uncharacterized protein n=1 Tax=Caligus rogercresseyi TaxID=217165 RepID=A0A7T8JZ15_CALRO|nr:Hypothetical protein FKW44_014537 [Caligus rogercresseyi]
MRSNLTYEERAIRAAISNRKAYISLKLTGEEIIESSKLRAIQHQRQLRTQLLLKRFRLSVEDLGITRP